MVLPLSRETRRLPGARGSETDWTCRSLTKNNAVGSLVAKLVRRGAC